jgi:large subunit ribosomal protein L35
MGGGRGNPKKEFAIFRGLTTFLLPMPKPISRSKTKKAVAKRFKITGTGKVMRAQASRRHLLSSKSSKRKRQMAKSMVVDSTDVARIIKNLPFSH